MAAALEQLARRAARPALGPVPAGAEAVIFLDRSELLACLACDWCAGSVLARWWWQSLFKGMNITRSILSEWLDAAEYVPAALQQLSESHKVISFIRVLRPAPARALLRALTNRFLLSEVQSEIDSLLDHQPSLVAREVQGITGDARLRRAGTRHALQGLSRSTPWQSWVPESNDPAMSLEQQCLLAVGLMLQRAPAVVRSRAFLRAVAEWREGAVDAGHPTINATITAPGKKCDSTNIKNPVLRQPEPPESRDESGEPFQELLRADSAGGEPDEELLLARRADHASSPLEASEDYQALICPGHSQPEPRAAVATPIRQDKYADQLSSLLLDAQTETELGGVFYLINVGLFLNLFGDFTTPAQPGIELPLWDYLALLGRRILGNRIAADPLWPLLERLAGRSEGEEPGTGFHPPDVWRLPIDWLAPFPEDGIWQWGSVGGRLLVRHPEQFWLLDVPLDNGDPESRLSDEIRAYAATAVFRLQRASVASDLAEARPLDRWIDWLTLYVGARLRRALGLSDPGEVARTVCEHRARILVTPVHLDIFLALNELPIEIRLAGLDRNPGWVPAAARIINFHFSVSL